MTARGRSVCEFCTLVCLFSMVASGLWTLTCLNALVFSGASGGWQCLAGIVSAVLFGVGAMISNMLSFR